MLLFFSTSNNDNVNNVYNSNNKNLSQNVSFYLKIQIIN